jgi:hypothetical protein
MVQVDSRRPLTAETWVRARVNVCGVCGGERVTKTDFSSISSAFPCRYHITLALHSHESAGG